MMLILLGVTLSTLPINQHATGNWKRWLVGLRSWGVQYQPPSVGTTSGHSMSLAAAYLYLLEIFDAEVMIYG